MLLNSVPQPFSGHTGTIAGIAFSPDGSRAVTGANRPQEFDRDAIVWDVPSGTVRMRLHGNQVGVFSVVYAPNGKRIVTGGGEGMMGNHWKYDSAIRFWTEDGLESGIITEDSFEICALAISADSRYLLSGSNNSSRASAMGKGSSITLWDLSEGRKIRTFGKHSSNVLSVALSSDGKYAAAGSTGFVFGMSTPSAPTKVQRDTERISTEIGGRGVLSRALAAAHRYSRRVKAAREPESLDLYSRTLRIWQVGSGVELDMFSHGESVSAVCFSPDGALLISAGFSVLLWDVHSGTQVRQVGGKEARFAHCAAISPDGRYIAVGFGSRSDPGSPYKDCFVIQYMLATCTEITRWHHNYPVTAVAFSPNGEFILAGGERGEIHLWETHGF